MQTKLLGIISVDFDKKCHIFCIREILEKKWEYKPATPLARGQSPCKREAHPSNTIAAFSPTSKKQAARYTGYHPIH